MISNLRSSRKWRLSILIVIAFLAFNSFWLLLTRSDGVLLVKPIPQSSTPGRERGFIDKVYVDGEGQAHRYIVFVPFSMTNEDRLPLILYLNGRGKNGSDGLAPLIDGIAPAIWERTHTFPFVVVWPQCPPDGSWSQQDKTAELALAVMRNTAKEYHTDPDRVYLSGISSGGSGTWEIAANHPDEFAAIAPISASTRPDVLAKLANAKMPVWMFSVAEDAGVSDGAIRNYDEMLKMGMSPHHSELRAEVGGRMDPHDAWSFAYRNQGLYRWLLLQSRTHRHKDTQRFELIKASQYHSTIQPFEELDQLETPPGRSQEGLNQTLDLSKLASMSDIELDKLNELHLEFRAAQGAGRFSIVLLDVKVNRARTGSALEISLDGLSSGGLHSWPDNQCVYPFLPESEQSYLPGRWNDLRLKRSNGRLYAELNGWPLFNAEKQIPELAHSRIGFLANGSKVEVRNLRVRRTAPATAATLGSDAIEVPLWKQRSDPKQSNPTLVDLTQIQDAWKHRERAFPTVTIRWTHGNPSPMIASTFRSTANSSKLTHKESQLVMTRSGIDYSTAWLNSRIDLGRTTGFSGSASQTDFLAALNSRFTLPEKETDHKMRLEVAIDDKTRRDEVFHEDQRGQRGIIFDRSNPWQDRIGELEDLFWRGAVLAFRPASKQGVDCDFDKCKVLPNAAFLGGVRCVVVEERTSHRNNSFARRFWVDPQRDFLILRMTAAQNGRLREQIDLNYKLNAEKQWVPDSWTAISRSLPANSNSYRYFSDNDQLFEVASADVTECNSNALIDQTSRAAFRSDAIVFDQTNNEWFQQLTSENRRKLDPDEIDADALRDHSSSGDFRWRNLLIGAGIVVLSFGWVIARRRQGKANAA